jgi:hypothetical protein
LSEVSSEVARIIWLIERLSLEDRKHLAYLLRRLHEKSEAA